MADDQQWYVLLPAGEWGVSRYITSWTDYRKISFLPNSGIQLADGTIFVGGINGFNEFHPDRLASPNQKTTVVLADFQLFNKPVKSRE